MKFCKEEINFKTKDLVEKFNKPSIYIRYVLRNNGIFYTKGARKGYKFDENYFKIIDSEEKAYWLGFILADGYINKEGKVGIELSVTDENHLYKFKNCLKSEAPINIYNKNSTFGKQTNCRFQISNETLYFSLLDLGITIRKTNEGVLPKITKDLTRHMIRGYFDGNGSFHIKELKLTDGYKCRSLNFCGTREILKSIEELSGFSWSWSKRIDNDTNNFQIAIGRFLDCSNFLNYMYKDSTIYLDRKYDKYLKLKI